mgnify:CR=1 FL=1
MTEDAIEQTARLLDRADEVLVFAGSGFSAESGVPTFRGEDGLFSDEKIAELAYAGTLERDPERALSWYEKGRNRIRQLEPNPGHYALTRLSQTGEFTVATQNVDGLLERAARREGVELEIHYIHGSLFRVRCHDCGRLVDRDVDLSTVPECGECGGFLRPDIVLFGEMLPREAFDASAEAAERADVCLLLGTSGIVYPAAGLPRETRRSGGKLVEINTEETELSEICDVTIRGKTGEFLPRIEEALESLR